MRTCIVFAILTGLAACASKQDAAPPGSSAAASAAAELTLPDGFTATIFADNVGQGRHLAVAPNGTVYLNTWHSPYDTGRAVPAGGYLVALRDTNQDGRADRIERFGPTRESGSHGGTGLALANGALYAESDSNIIRIALDSTALVPTAAPVTIVTGLTMLEEHPQHTVAVKGTQLYVTVGSLTNSCQVQNRQQESPGQRPCRELETRAGVWRYDALKEGQRFSPKERYASGLRNAMGIAVNPADSAVYTTIHGRDDLWGNWPRLYTQKTGANLPSETLVKLVERGDYGWPYCYHDPERMALVLNPEYGGDGKKVGDCATRLPPVAFYPAHWAPNGLAWYNGTMFPESYRGGAFIAFHGSWNRAPEPQGGYNVVFQPFKDGKPVGDYQVFADGFAEGKMQPNTAAHRPVGVAVGPDGALYVSDDVGGRVWRVIYGDKKAGEKSR
jgi:glucose/arabinose dehydrogenase